MRTYLLAVSDELVSVNTTTGEGLKYLFEILNIQIRSMASSYFIDGEDVNDKIQKLQIKILQIIPKYNPAKASFNTWVNRCLKNEIRNQIKYNKRRHNTRGYLCLNKSEIDRRYAIIDEKDRGYYDW